MHVHILLMLNLFICFISADNNHGDIPEGVANGGRPENPGVKSRLTQNGLNYLNEILAYEMTEIIPKLRVDNLQHSDGKTQIQVTNARITHYKPPRTQTLTLQPPDQIQWLVQGADVSMTAHIKGKYGTLAEQGDVDATATDIDYTISITPIRQQNGQFGVQSRNCNCQIKKLDMNIRNTGAIGRMLQSNKAALIHKFKPELEKKLCEQTRKMIDEAANKQLASMPTKVPLNESEARGMMYKELNGNDAHSSHQHGNGNNGNGNNGNGNNGNGNNGNRNHGNGNGNGNGNNNKNKNKNAVNNGHDQSNRASDQSNHHNNVATSKESIEEEKGKAILNNVTKHLMFDYSNLKNPTVFPKYVETQNKGEISYHGLGQTPFFPPPMHEHTPVPYDRMAYLLASDYVANSMLYQAYSHRLLDYKLNAHDTPEFKNYLRTSCSSDNGNKGNNNANSDSDGDILGVGGETCLGTFVPEVESSFPNSQAEILFEPKQSPAMFFRKDNSINIVSKDTLISLFAVKGGERKLMASGDLDFNGQAKLFIDQQRLKGNVSIDNMNLRLKENHLKGFDQKRADELATMAQMMLEAMVNANLKKGIKLPTTREVKLVNTKLTVFDRTIRIDSDFQADKQELTKIAVKAIRKNGGRVEGYND